MTDDIDIPASALEVKAWFPDRPKPEVVREIKDFIKATGTPYLWHGHTHTKPPKGASIIYLGEFDLPESHRKVRERWSPCPCCVPRNPKFCREGKIGYFPDERVIRILGPDCFRTLNPEGHDRAYDDMRAEEKREADINFLLSKMDGIPSLISAIEHALPVAAAVDSLGATLRAEIDSVLRTRFWEQIREGQLRMTVVRNVPFRRADGSEGSRPEESFENYGGQLRGIALFNPRTTAVAPRLKRLIAPLEDMKIDGPYTELIKAWRDDIRNKTAKTLSSSITTARESFDAIDDMRAFFSGMNLANIKGWNNQPNCPIRIFMDYDGSSVSIGRAEHDRRRFPVDRDFETVLRRPDILALAQT